MATTTTDPVHGDFVEERAAVERTLEAILEAVRRKDFVALAAFHLDSPKFTKFDDFEPLERQDYATATRSEEDGLGSVDDFRYRLRDVKVDVFGPVAVATFVLDYGFDAGGEAVDVSARTTMVLVDDRGHWRIAHEHLSPFKSNP